MKVFISQPMNGLTDDEIKAKREELTAAYPDAEIIDSFFEGAPHDATPLWYLGKSIQLLGTADLAIFAKGWEKKRGCRIEHAVAVEYGIETTYE